MEQSEDGTSWILQPKSVSCSMDNATLSPDPVPGDETASRAETARRPFVLVSPAPPRFPDVLAEITRAQPLTMLSIAFVAGLIMAAGWRR
jgi:hypothetical protein